MSGSLPVGAARPVSGLRGGFEMPWGRVDLFRWSLAGVLVGMMIWGLVDVRRRGRVDPQHPEVHKTDFTVYTIAGQTMLYGGDPYSVANSRGWKYIYPPLFALLVSPLGDFDPQIQVLVWFAVSVLLAWGCLRECVRIAEAVLPDEPRRGVFGPIPTWIGAAAVTAAAVPALNCLQRGQTGIAVLYFLLVGFRWLVESKSAAWSLAAGALLALPIVLKATPVVPVAFVLGVQAVSAWCAADRVPRIARSVASAAGMALGLALFLLVVPAAIVGWDANVRHLGTWWTTVASQEEGALNQDYAGDNTTERNQSLTNAVHRFGNWLAGEPQPLSGVWAPATPESAATRPMDGPLVKMLLSLVRGAAACLLVMVGWRVGRSNDSLGLAVGLSLAYLATLVVCQIARGHYFAIWLPTVMFTSIWLERHRQPRTAAWLTLAPVGLVLMHYLFMSWAGAIGLLGLGTAVWYVTACGAIIGTPTAERVLADNRVLRRAA
jgi:hypothetical protein